MLDDFPRQRIGVGEGDAEPLGVMHGDNGNGSDEHGNVYVRQQRDHALDVPAVAHHEFALAAQKARRRIARRPRRDVIGEAREPELVAFDGVEAHGPAVRFELAAHQRVVLDEIEQVDMAGVT